MDVLRHSRAHPDAAQVHAAVREQLPQVSLGTVYRTLDALVKDGLVVTIESAGQATRYDFRRENDDHHHAVCRCCGAIFDVPLTQPVALPAHTLPAGFQVTDVRLEFRGICEACAKKQQQN